MFSRRSAAIGLIVGLAVLAAGTGGCRTMSKADRPSRAEPAQGEKKREEKPGLLTSVPHAITFAPLEIESA